MTGRVPEPPRLAQRPHDRHGRPVPFFALQTGPAEWDLRVADGEKLRAALGTKGRGRTSGSPPLCWVCGFPFLRQEDRAFVIGPMCAVNHTSAEPPSHEECALYSAQACPFLATPRMVRRTRHLPEGTEKPGGHMLERNPGVTLVWVTRYNSWWRKGDQRGGFVFDIGHRPLRVSWWAEGRPATRAEVAESIDSGLPALQEIAERDGPAAMDLLSSLLAEALALLPDGESLVEA